jgi:hypothetical protein
MRQDGEAAAEIIAEAQNFSWVKLIRISVLR